MESEEYNSTLEYTNPFLFGGGCHPSNTDLALSCRDINITLYFLFLFHSISIQHCPLVNPPQSFPVLGQQQIRTGFFVALPSSPAHDDASFLSSASCTGSLTEPLIILFSKNVQRGRRRPAQRQTIAISGFRDLPVTTPSLDGLIQPLRYLCAMCEKFYLRKLKEQTAILKALGSKEHNMSQELWGKSGSTWKYHWKWSWIEWCHYVSIWEVYRMKTSFASAHSPHNSRTRTWAHRRSFAKKKPLRIYFQWMAKHTILADRVSSLVAWLTMS